MGRSILGEPRHPKLSRHSRESTLVYCRDTLGKRLGGGKDETGAAGEQRFGDFPGADEPEDMVLPLPFYRPVVLSRARPYSGFSPAILSGFFPAGQGHFYVFRYVSTGMKKFTVHPHKARMNREYAIIRVNQKLKHCSGGNLPPSGPQGQPHLNIQSAVSRESRGTSYTMARRTASFSRMLGMPPGCSVDRLAAAAAKLPM